MVRISDTLEAVFRFGAIDFGADADGADADALVFFLVVGFFVVSVIRLSSSEWGQRA
jgi:hypothetical protein